MVGFVFLSHMFLQALLLTFGPFVAFANSLIAVLREVGYVCNFLCSSSDVRFSWFLVSSNHVPCESVDAEDSFFDVCSDVSVLRGVDPGHDVELSCVL